MIDTDALRSKILDLAIQGKLTEQLPTDGNAEELYQQIQAEKAQLIKEKKIKKEKPLPEITAEEIPFDVPDNWKWVRLANVINLQSGQDLTKEEYGDIPKGIPYITGASNFASNQNLVINRWTEFPKSKAIEGDILLSCKGTVGKLTVLDIEEVHLARQVMGIRGYQQNNLYLKYFLQCIINGIKAASKGLIPGIERNDVLSLCYPLPPLAEQQRIVAKIEEALSALDEIDNLQEQYKNDTEVLKSKLIEAAIQGKLTEQLPEDGTAEELYQSIQAEKAQLIKEKKIKKEKTLSKISDDEIPFDIPTIWKWVRISDVIDVRDGTHDSPKYHDKGIPLVTSKNISSGELSFDDVKLISADDAQKINERSYVDDGDILFAMIGSIGNPVIVHKDREFCIKNVALFKNFAPMHISMEYVYWFLMYEQFVLRKNAIGGLQPFVSLKVFRNHLMPLPPLNEQMRITERLHALMDVVSE